MKPYYEQDGVTIYHGDCWEVLPSLSADAVVTDPPYGILDRPNTFLRDGVGRGGRRHGDGAVNTWHNKSEWDRRLDPSWLPIAMMIGPVAMFGQWRKRISFECAAKMEPRAEIVWVKDMHCGAPVPVAPRDERIWIFSINPFRPSRFETSVWEEPVIPTWEYKHHKNEKPLALMKRLITWLPAKSIIDPFMGSGTTLRAAKDCGLNAIGIEIEERYCEIAAKRLAQGVLSLKLEEGLCRDTESQLMLDNRNSSEW